jgi:ABC-2 type transport system ATP-binding protein
MIEIKNLTKKYGEKTAIKNVTITIDDGEIFAFIGHNGAGKTTTIKCLMGIMDFDEGSIIINGKSIMDYPIECKKEMAYVPDNPDLYENLTANEFINFMADMYDIDVDTRIKNISKYAKMFDLENNLNDYISTFSHGMKQKVALIAALVHEPKILVMDEPFVGLDPTAVHDMKEVMKKMCDEGKIIFFSTHILDVAEKLCTKVAIIKNGEVIRKGSMQEIKGDESLEDVFLELDKDGD